MPHDTTGTAGSSWERFQHLLLEDAPLGLSLDVSRMPFAGAELARIRPQLAAALEAMRRLEAGEIANPDEGRPVGHYWLRDPQLAPDPATAAAILETAGRVQAFADAVRSGKYARAAGPLCRVLLIGIGGSALGPQLLCDALLAPRIPGEPMLGIDFLDNTDPRGIHDLLARLEPDLDCTLVIVISKSGGTPETRNGMLEVEAAYARRGLAFGPHAVAVTSAGSSLEAYAREHGFLEIFPMWEWVGGRTSVTSVVGLLPAALLGIDIAAFLDGARVMDRWTREPDPERNPAAMLALAWYVSGGGRGGRDMVILPYCDRLALLGRYLQQLVMESLGKERDLDGRLVHQGLVVYGNKGSTDQHAYVQQLREGRDDFFATFIQVRGDGLAQAPQAGRMRDGSSRAPTPPLFVEPDVTSGDYLLGFLLGTREALTEKGRGSILITLHALSARTLGALIALFERTVGLYASLIHVNAYHQPGVEAGKRAAGRILGLERALLELLRHEGLALTAPAAARRVGPGTDTEATHHLLEHLAANGRVRVETEGAGHTARYRTL